jgi:bifunctional lysine-specific demethylase and histidyl-hydroxylase NO66
VLRPGDALYLPRGYLHAAEALGEVSAHLTVGIHPVTRQELVEALAALLPDDPELRQSLPLGIDVADASALTPDLDTTIEAMVAGLRRVSAADVARRVRGRVWGSTRATPLSPLRQAAATAAVGNDTTVQRRGALRYTIDTSGDSVVVLLPDRTVALPKSTKPALEALLSGEPVAVGALPNLDADEQVVLVRRLLREGVVVPVRA